MPDGAWKPGAWAPGAWAGGAWGEFVQCSLDVTEEDDTLSATATGTSATIGGRLHRKLWAEPAANDDEEVLMITNAFFDQVVRR